MKDSCLLIAIILSLLAAGAWAQLPHPFDLNTLNGTNGIRLDGIDPNDQSGLVSGAGDINGDGFADLLIGAGNAGNTGPGNIDGHGETYLIYGSASLTHPIDLSALNGTNGVRLDGIDAGDLSGYCSGAGDVNSDGLDDLLIGAVWADPGGDSEAGETYLVYGSASLTPPFDLSTLNGTNGVRFDGIDPNDRSGGVSGAGDVNGDGLADLLIGAYNAGNTGPGNFDGYGETYLVYGSASGVGSGAASLELSSLNGANGVRFDGIDPGDGSGVSISGAGDVNGDGFDDLLIGAIRADPGGDSEAGETYLVYGSASLTHPFDLSTLNDVNGVRLDGIDAGDLSCRVSGAGDVNGDGYADLLIGASHADPGGVFWAGETYLIYGSASLTHPIDLNALNGTTGVRLPGIDPNDHSGISVSGASDVNGDGLADLLIGAFSADPAGETYLVYGSTSLTHPIDLNALNGTNGIRLDGIDEDDGSGVSVSGAGDVNGDGLADLLIGASQADPGGPGNTREGETYLVYGSGTATSATCRTFSRSGDAPRIGVGLPGDGSITTPISRCRIDYDAGSGPGNGGSSLETVTLIRSKAGITDLGPIAGVADVVWEVTTNRASWASAEVTFHHLDSEIAGLVENNLVIFQASALSGPWIELPTVVDTTRNEATVTVTGFSFFALAEAGTVPVELGEFSSE